MNRAFPYIFAFTTLDALLRALLILAALFVLIAAVLLLGMVIRRKSKTWRRETVQDLIKFKFFSVSFGVSSLLSVIFLPYIAVPLWVGCYQLLEKRLCKRDMLAMAHFDAHPLYEKHPMQALRAYRAQIKAQKLTDDEKGTYVWALKIYVYLVGLMAVPFVTAMLSETAREMHLAAGVININIAAICLFVSFYILVCWGHNAANHGSIIVPVLAFVVFIVILNVFLISTFG